MATSTFCNEYYNASKHWISPRAEEATMQQISFGASCIFYFVGSWWDWREFSKTVLVSVRDVLLSLESQSFYFQNKNGWDETCYTRVPWKFMQMICEDWKMCFSTFYCLCRPTSFATNCVTCYLMRIFCNSAWWNLPIAIWYILTLTVVRFVSTLHILYKQPNFKIERHKRNNIAVKT